MRIISILIHKTSVRVKPLPASAGGFFLYCAGNSIFELTEVNVFCALKELAGHMSLGGHHDDPFVPGLYCVKQRSEITVSGHQYQCIKVIDITQRVNSQLNIKIPFPLIRILGYLDPFHLFCFDNIAEFLELF